MFGLARARVAASGSRSLRWVSQSAPRYQVDDEDQNSPPKPTFMEKCQGVEGAAAPVAPSIRAIAFSGATSFLGIGTLSLLHYGMMDASDSTLILGSMGATAGAGGRGGWRGRRQCVGR